MTDLFKDIIPSIMQTKKHVLVDELSTKTYNSFMVNKSLSFHPDCVLQANEMNINWQLDNKLQYDYLLNNIRPKKRPFVKWGKKTEDSDVDSICLYFGYSKRAARELIQAEVLSKSQLEFIRKQTTID